jgi:hypothetical protein
MAWMVDARPPESWTRESKWDFKYAFFPRKVYRQKDANQLAQEARDKGGQEVKVWKCK